MIRSLLVAAAATLLSASAHAQSDDKEGFAAAYAPVGERSSADAWTPEKMAAAQAMPVPVVSLADIPGVERGATGGEPGFAEAADGEDVPDQHERKSGVVRARPLYWAGKLYFNEPEGDFECSAQFIKPNVILTAAHCVRDPQSGDWFQNFAFASQYENGKADKVYDYDCVSTLNGWVQESGDRYHYDFAAIRVKEKSRIGWFGITWNWEGSYNSLVKIGYPGSMKNGQVIQVEQGPIELVQGLVQLNHGNRNSQKGSSGGAWIGKYTTADGTKNNYVASLQSFSLNDSADGISYGPYFTDAFKTLVTYAENGCK
jgi:V8-like Glu-specific endopeptidase